MDPELLKAGGSAFGTFTIATGAGVVIRWLMGLVDRQNDRHGETHQCRRGAG
jgi:hypothetical protein